MIEQTLYWCIIRDGGHIIAPRQYIDQIDLEQVKIQWKIRYEWRQRHKMEVFCRMCGVSSEESIVTMRSEFGDVLCQPCYEKRLDEWARSFREG